MRTRRDFYGIDHRWEMCGGFVSHDLGLLQRAGCICVFVSVVNWPWQSHSGEEVYNSPRHTTATSNGREYLGIQGPR